MGNLKSLIQRIFKADIVKVFSLNAVSTLVHMCTGLISIKVVASIIGPSGVAILGQLNNLNTMLQGLAAGGIRNGVTKFIAEHKEDEHKIRAYIGNALRIAVAFTFLVSLVCIFGSNLLSEKVMLSTEYSYVFIVLGFTIFLFTLNSLLVSILNGFKEFRKYVIVNIASSVVSLIFSVSLCLLWGLKGAMINAVTFQSVVLIVTIIQCRRCLWFKSSNFFVPRDNEIVKQYLQYTLMALVTLSISPVSQMILRGYVISEISATEAGWWEGMNRISHVYLSVITTSLSVYILPRMSEISDKWKLKQEIFKCYKFILPMLLVCIIVIYFLRFFIIWLLFTPDFYPMESLFIWQLLGDFFKIASWLLSFLMLAKARTKAFVTTEILFGLNGLCIRFILVNMLGTIGLNIGYMLNFILYLICMIWLFRDIVFCKKPVMNG